MTTTAAAPKAPLPWRTYQQAPLTPPEVGSVDLNGPGDYACDAYSTEDAAYIVHAANAYPKLVAALVMVRDFNVLPWDEFDAKYGVDDSKDDADRITLDRVSTLLRELGELERPQENVEAKSPNSAGAL